MQDFINVKKVYFLGIGGIGVSAIAKMFLQEGKMVFGSDTSSSEITEELKKEGADVFIGQDISHVPEDTDLVVYTIALDKFASEFMREVRQKIKKVISYPQALNIISKDKYTIAICGTHGKTTTTAMVAKILIDAGLDPTVIVGSKLLDQKSNFVAGKSKYLVVEACEYCRSFLEINPTIIGITTIDDDHLDYYKDSNDILQAFGEFVDKTTEAVIGNFYDANIKNVITNYELRVTNKEKIKIINSNIYFDKNLKLKIPGEHNRKDASVALAIADFLGIPKKSAIASLENFSGTWRRFEYKGETSKGTKVYDDYGHHPTEIKATISGAREMFPNSKIIVVFQPHLYSRTKSLLPDFQTAFEVADKTILLPIYPAREVFDPTISSENIITDTNKNIEMAKDFQGAAEKAFEYANKDDVILVMGAGDIYEVSGIILKKISLLNN